MRQVTQRQIVLCLRCILVFFWIAAHHQDIHAANDEAYKPGSLFKLLNIFAQDGTGDPTLNHSEDTETMCRRDDRDVVDVELSKFLEGYNEFGWEKDDDDHHYHRGINSVWICSSSTVDLRMNVRLRIAQNIPPGWSGTAVISEETVEIGYCIHRSMARHTTVLEIVAV